MFRRSLPMTSVPGREEGLFGNPRKVKERVLEAVSRKRHKLVDGLPGLDPGRTGTILCRVDHTHHK